MLNVHTQGTWLAPGVGALLSLLLSCAPYQCWARACQWQDSCLPLLPLPGLHQSHWHLAEAAHGGKRPGKEDKAVVKEKNEMDNEEEKKNQDATHLELQERKGCLRAEKKTPCTSCTGHHVMLESGWLAPQAEGWMGAPPEPYLEWGRHSPLLCPVLPGFPAPRCPLNESHQQCRCRSCPINTALTRPSP